MKKFADLLKECESEINELMPWDLMEKIAANPDLILLDVREPSEFNAMHIKGSINVPRGILETSCDWGYDETIPNLVESRDKEVIVICRSGNRSLLAAQTMQIMGYQNPISLKTGLRGWNDYEQPLQNINGQPVDIDDADEFFMSKVKPEQMPPKP
ncbi:MAG: rhodanese-like domain-containing protein [Gammaproteobacteria bacterium]|nr:rhodanese-like domain-containing protein [Gammaproteobacteria bacterium]